MYLLIATICTLIRQFCLPDPFECFGDMAILYNCIAAPVICILSYLLTGAVYLYQTDATPIFGSILYLLMYALLTGILWVFGLFSFAWWWVAIVIVICGIAVYGIRRLLERWY